MREEEDGTLYMWYPGYDVEVELPNSKLALYSVKSLTLQMRKREPARHSIAEPPMTRNRARQATGEAGSSRQPPISSSAEEPPHLDPATAHMNFEQTYDYYQQQGTSSYGMPGYGQDFYYPADGRDEPGAAKDPR
jgi:hypothetical protein